MKKVIFTLLTLITISTYAQVGIGTTTPDNSSILELESTTQGMLTPRMLESERDAIATPATGLLIYQTNNTPGFYYYNSTAWVPFGGVDNDWTIHTNGLDMYNANTGNVGVGNTAPTAQLHVTGTASGGGGGTTTIYTQDFSSMVIGDVTSSTGISEHQIIAGAGNDVWEVVSSSESYVSVLCTGCTGQWINIRFDCTSQDETFVTGQFTPSATATSLDISFDYRYRYEDGSDEAYNVTLFNETDNSVASTLIALTTTSANTVYSGTFNFSGANTATDTYSLRFQYVGNCDWGASLDNVSVIENTIAAPTSSVFRLEDGTQQAGYVLTSDANGNATWQASSEGGTDSQALSISGSDLTISNGNTITLPSGGGGSITADNGLNVSSGSNVRLGGVLVQGTTIDLDDNDLLIDGTSTGEFEIDGNTKRMMTAKPGTDYVAFGSGSGSPNGAFDNQMYSINGTSYTLDVVLGYSSGNTGGSGFKMGSIEYVLDGGAELFMDGGAAISPFYDAFSFADLGNTDAIVNSTRTTTGEWEDIYAQNTVTVSDRRSKSNIHELKYGLTEILKLKPVSFDYKKQLERQKEYNAPRELIKQKLGFIAQDLEGVLPEVVKTHDWKVVDEKTKQVEYKENNMYGVMYSDIVPVTVKAIQEQQEQIETLKSEVSELKALVNKLTSEKK